MGEPPFDEAVEAKRAARAEALQQSAGDTEAFVKKFASHTERGVALGVVAYLDTKVTTFISRMFIDDDAVKQNMLRPEGGPLGSLGAKIKLCYLFGFLEKQTYLDLKNVTSIRNEFAHNEAASNFSYPKVVGLSKKISIFVDAVNFFGGPEESSVQIQFYKDIGYNLSDPKWGFVAAVGYLANKFQTNGHHLVDLRTNRIRILF